jgi:galactokinase
MSAASAHSDRSPQRPHTLLSARVRDRFEERFGRAPRLFGAPGRVNLIGEFTDYNDGFVLPMAIDRETIVAAAARGDRRVRVHSMALGECEIDLDASPRRRRGEWIDYVEGVARSIEAAGIPLVGADLVIGSDVPAGAGLSSSAALEISIGLALLAMANRALPAADLAVLAQRAEHETVGVLCGIMDQLTAAVGRAGHALLIDCRNLAWVPVPLEATRAAVLVSDTQVRHSLASSAYNDRRSECARAVMLVKRAFPRVRALRDVDDQALRTVAKEVPDPLHRRARHVVTENQRTTAAAIAMASSDLHRFGQLMFESHESLRADFEVTVPELDVLVARARTLDGVYGARMTGGGFGGCVVSLVERDAVAAVSEALREAFFRAFGRDLEVFEARASEGGRELL